MTTATAPRFNTQKDVFSKNIKELQNEVEKLLNELQGGERIKVVKPKIFEFAEKVKSLVNDLETRINFFAKLASSISELSENTWLEEAGKPHSEGIFHWMHNEIIKLLKKRWNELNLGNGNGPSEPPPYNNPNFKNYKQIIKNQNNRKLIINNERVELMRQLGPLSNKLDRLAKKVIPNANQASSRQPQAGPS